MSRYAYTKYLDVLNAISTVLFACLLCLICFFIASSARAVTLNEALATAYQNNPLLQAERASLRSKDEGRPQILSAMRPSLSIQMDTGALHRQTLGEDLVTDLRPSHLSMIFSQVVFDGFRTRHALLENENIILAGRELLHNVEQKVFIDVVKAYMNILSKDVQVSLGRENLQFLNNKLQSARDRFAVGDLTRIDVAQAEAEVAGSETRMIQHTAQLVAAKAAYQRVIGHFPDILRQPEIPVDFLPHSLEQAIGLAEAYHPAILSAHYLSLAAKQQIKVNTGELYPRLSLEVLLNRGYDVMRSGDQIDMAGIVGQVSVPIYQSGRVLSKVRQSKQVMAQRNFELDMICRRVRAAVISVWVNYEAAKARVNSSLALIAANEVAMAGIEKEAEMSQRTMLDVLKAQHAVVKAKAAYAKVLRDRMVLAYQLIASIGKLQADVLQLDVQLYDPTSPYSHVREKAVGLSIP